MRITLLTVALGVLLVAGSPSARAKVQADGDPNFDFSTLKTFSWPADGPGQLKMAVTKDSDPEPLRKRFEPVIVSAVEANLTGRGLREGRAAATALRFPDGLHRPDQREHGRADDGAVPARVDARGACPRSWR